MTYQRLDMKNIALIAGLALSLTLGAALPHGGATAALGLTPSVASAQSQVGPNLKGSIGLGLVGAELGLVIPAAAGLDDTWALVVFPIVGGAGGAIAGHFLLDDGNRTLSIGALALGVALVVPSVVLTLSLTAYDPEDDGAVESNADSGDGGDGADAAGSEGDTSVEVDSGGQARVHRRRVARAGAGLFRVSEDGLLLGVPGVSVLPTQDRAELSFMRSNEGTELRFSLVSGVF